MHKNEHLSVEVIAQAADSLHEASYTKLPEAVRHHISTCDRCANEILEVYSMTYIKPLQDSANSRDKLQELFSRTIKHPPQSRFLC